MIVPDANLLLYAVDETSPFHSVSRSWLEKILNGKEEVGLCHPVVFAFVRLSTHRKIFQSPLTLEQSFGYIQEWLDQPVCRILASPLSQIEDVKNILIQASSPGGNLVTDAQIASIALSYKATIHTADRDFLRFASVKIYFPLSKTLP